MTTKRTLLINMFDAEHHHAYMYHTNFDFLRKCSDVDIIEHLPSHLDKVDLSQYTNRGAKSYLQLLYVVFQDIKESLFLAKENDVNNLKAVFLQYFKETDESDVIYIHDVFDAPDEQMATTARKILNMDEQPYKLVLDKVLETIDEINGCFIIDNKPVVQLEQKFLDRIQAVS